MDNDTPRAWVGCLACYNDGRLNGTWLDDPDDIREWKCDFRDKRWPDDSPHEEFWVFDHEHMPFIDGECSPSEFADTMEKLDDLDSWQPLEAVAAWLYNHHESILTADLDNFNDAYAGEFDSVEDYAEDFAESYGMIDHNATWPMSYIDWERAARDLVLGGDIWTVEAPSGVYVFNGNV